MLPLQCPKGKWRRSARFSPYIPFKCHLAWMWGDIWKVLSHAPHMKTLVWCSWHMVMLDGCELKFEKSSCIALCMRTFVVEGTFGHARWMWGEIWKVILCATHVRTLVWWSWHLVTLDRCEVRFEKSSHVHLMWELWCDGGDSWSC